jgi:signal peptidase II
MANARPLRLTWIALACAAVIVLADQALKDLLIQILPVHQSVPFLGDVVRLYLTYNDSAAFSMGYGQTWIFAILSTLASLALIWFLPRMTTKSWAIMAGIALGGVVGNLVDRLIRQPGFGVGQVVDYIQIPFNFPIFNLADSAIVLVAIATVIRIMRGNQIGK